MKLNTQQMYILAKNQIHLRTRSEIHDQCFILNIKFESWRDCLFLVIKMYSKIIPFQITHDKEQIRKNVYKSNLMQVIKRLTSKLSCWAADSTGLIPPLNGD